MKSSKIKIYLIFSFLFIYTNSYSQATSENLKNIVNHSMSINSSFKLFDKLYGGLVIESVGEKINLIADELKVIDEKGTDDEQYIATYFYVSGFYVYGKLFQKMEEYETAEKIFKTIEKNLNLYTSSDFPINYTYLGTKYAINWKDFAPIQAELKYELGVNYFNTKKYTEAISYLKQHIAANFSTQEDKYRSCNMLTYAMQEVPDIATSDEVSKYALEFLKTYDNLSNDLKKKVTTDSTYPQMMDGINTLISLGIKPTSTYQVLGNCGLGAKLASKYEPANSKILSLYEICLQKFHSDAELGLIYAFIRELPKYEFLKEAQNYALGMRNIDKTKSEWVGLTALEKMAEMANSNNCNKYSDVADLYRVWGKPELETKYRKQYEICFRDAEKARKKAERKQNSYDNNFNMYLGINVLPLLNTNIRRDYGGVVNFTVRQTGLELSYLKINQNKENIFDLWINEVDDADQDNISRWDGFYAHVQPKFFDKNNASYLGILLGYAQKDFAPMTVNVTDLSTSTINPEQFDPSVKQYIAMINFGILKLKPGIGIDAYWGIGANYSIFDHGTTIDINNYSIDNPLLENRRKPYFGFIMRFGFSIGLNIGSGN